MNIGKNVTDDTSFGAILEKDLQFHEVACRIPQDS